MDLYERRLDIDKNCYLVKLERNAKNIENIDISNDTHLHKSVQILFPTKGNTRANIGEELIEIEQGQIVFIDSLETHSFLKGKIEGYLVVLGCWYVDAFNSLFLGKRFPRIMDDVAKNEKIFDFISNWYDWYSAQDKSINEEFLYETFLRANQLFKMLKNSYGMIDKFKTSDSAIYGILNYVNEHFQEDITIKEIALKLGYAKEYCSQIFNRYMGESFRQYLNRKRIEKFQQIYSAQKDEMSIAEISKICGFDCQATFYRAYRSFYGKTPKNKKSE